MFGLGSRIKVIRKSGFFGEHGVIATIGHVDEDGEKWDYGVLLGKRAWRLGFMEVELVSVNMTVLEGVIDYTKDHVPGMLTTDGQTIFPLAGYGGKRVRITIEVLEEG